jgi:hypothetical protein
MPRRFQPLDRVARRAEFREWEKRPRNLRVAPHRDRPLEPGKAECCLHSRGWIEKDGRRGGGRVDGEPVANRRGVGVTGDSFFWRDGELRRLTSAGFVLRREIRIIR